MAVYLDDLLFQDVQRDVLHLAGEADFAHAVPFLARNTVFHHFLAALPRLQAGRPQPGQVHPPFGRRSLVFQRVPLHGFATIRHPEGYITLELLLFTIGFIPPQTSCCALQQRGGY